METVDREILLEAADILEKKGWVTGEWSTSKGEHCLVGAVQLAARRRKVSCKNVMEILRDFLGVRSLTRWNDQKAKGSSEVIKVLRTAATHETDT